MTGQQQRRRSKNKDEIKYDGYRKAGTQKSKEKRMGDRKRDFWKIEPEQTVQSNKGHQPKKYVEEA